MPYKSWGDYNVNVCAGAGGRGVNDVEAFKVEVEVIVGDYDAYDLKIADQRFEVRTNRGGLICFLESIDALTKMPRVEVSYGPKCLTTLTSAEPIERVALTTPDERLGSVGFLTVGPMHFKFVAEGVLHIRHVRGET